MIYIITWLVVLAFFRSSGYRRIILNADTPDRFPTRRGPLFRIRKPVPRPPSGEQWSWPDLRRRSVAIVPMRWWLLLWTDNAIPARGHSASTDCVALFPAWLSPSAAIWYDGARQYILNNSKVAISNYNNS